MNWLSAEDRSAYRKAYYILHREKELRQCREYVVTNRERRRTAANRRNAANPEKVAWTAMHRRCEYKNGLHYQHYGGRGIKVCERWNSFEAFLADMGLKPSKTHSLDRINNDGNYEPGNCRWATKKEQAANRRPRRQGATNVK